MPNVKNEKRLKNRILVLIGSLLGPLLLRFLYNTNKIEIIEASHPVPDINSYNAAKKILNITKNYMNSVSQTMNSTMYINQKLKIIVGEIKCENLNISQEAIGTMKTMGQLSSKQLTNLTDKLKNQIQTDLETIIDNSNKGRMAQRLGNVNTTVNEDKKKIKE